MAAARADAGWAYQRLYEAHAPPVRAYARGQGSEDPDGLVNEVFLRAFRGLDRFQGDEDGFRAWLFVIARNALIDERRRQARRPPTVGGVALERTPLPDGGADLQALERIGAERVHDVLRELSAEQRDVLLLRIVADLTVEQVATVLGKQSGAVKQLQRRGLDALRRRMTDQGEW